MTDITFRLLIMLAISLILSFVRIKEAAKSSQLTKGNIMKRRKVVYADDVIQMLEKHWMSGVYPNASDVMNLPNANEWKKIEKDGEPDTKRDVYITYTSGQTGIGWYDEYTDNWLTDRNSYRGSTPKCFIKAWTELPQAYEGGDCDEES